MYIVREYISIMHRHLVVLLKNNVAKMVPYDNADVPTYPMHCTNEPQ